MIRKCETDQRWKNIIQIEKAKTNNSSIEHAAFEISTEGTETYNHTLIDIIFENPTEAGRMNNSSI
jgi:hypothetical protein